MTISTSNAEAVRGLIEYLVRNSIRPASGLFLAIDEAHRFCNDRENDVLKLAFMEGRHYGITPWYASQKVQALPSTLLTNADVCCVGYLPAGADKSYWRRVGMTPASRPFEFNLFGNEIDGISITVGARGEMHERATDRQ